MRRCILNKKNKLIITSSILFIFLTLLFYSMFNSKYLTIVDIEVIVDQGEIPPSIYDYIKKYNHMNIFRINCKEIDSYIENNAFIDQSKSKITIGKKLIIDLKKIKVDAIIKSIDNNNYAIISDNEIFKVIEKDYSLIDSNLLLIEMNNKVLNSLLNNNNINKFKHFIENMDTLYEYCYLISSVKYDNNINNSFGFLELKLNNDTTLIRIRNEVDSLIIKKAIELSQELSANNKEDTVLDVYHEAIIKRNLSLGG